MLGCFGRRKKKNKDAGHEPKAANSSRYGNNDRTTSAAATAAAELDKTKLPQQQPLQPQQLPHAKEKPQEELKEANEAITVARSHSVQHAAPKPGNIKKAATMSRYDFLRKQENLNYADRWAALKHRYLAPLSEAVADGSDFEAGEAAPDAVSARNGPKSPIRATVQSLPRKLSPPFTVVSPVKFSDWFYERKTKESQARQEFLDREKRMLKIIEGPSSDEMEEAAVKIQAGYKGYKTRKEVRARRESQDGEHGEHEQHPHVDEAAEDGTVAPAEEVDPNDSELTEAATKIQAGFKGYQTRQQLNDETQHAGEHEETPEPAAHAEEETPAPAAAEEGEVEAEAAAGHPTENKGIDLNDPGQNEAAAKIQAGFRGMRARREVAEMRKQHPADDAEASQDAARDAPGDAAEDAAGDDVGDVADNAVEEAVDAAVEEVTEEAKPEAEPEAEPEAGAEPEVEAELEAEQGAEPAAEAEHTEEHPDEPEAPEAEAAEAEETAAAPAGENEEKQSPDAGGAEAGEEPEAS